MRNPVNKKLEHEMFSGKAHGVTLKYESTSRNTFISASLSPMSDLFPRRQSAVLLLQAA